MTYNGLVMVLERRRANGWQGLVHIRSRGRMVCSPRVGRRPQAPRSARWPRHPVPRALRSGAIPTISRTPAAGSPTIVPTSSARWAAPTCHELASSSRPTSSTSAANPGRPRRWLPSRRTASSASCSSRPARGACRRKRCSRCACRGRFLFSGLGRIELLLDVLNALNNKAEDGLLTDNLSSQNFAQPITFVDPRRAMLSVRVNLGR
jgi:hypothetical protein